MRNKILGFAVLLSVAVMGGVGNGAGAQESPGAVQKTGGAAVGAEVVHPAAWEVEREPYTYEGTYGYTLWHPDTDEAHDHGGQPALRVALARDLKPGDIRGEVDRILADYPDVDQKRQRVDVARKHKGTAVGPIPGSTPFTRVYVPVNGRVYTINVYARHPGEEGLDAGDRDLLSAVRFEQPSRSAEALDVVGANSPEALYPSVGEQRALQRRDDGKAPEGAAITPTDDASSRTITTSRNSGDEKRIREGCWQADPDFFVQTQHGYGANGNPGDDIPKGWSQIGLPNFWGQYTHGSLGYGRCNEPNWANDKYAIDYPLNKWDYVFSPVKCGRVTFAGRNQSHADYGIFVSIKACNGKYWNLTAHLTALKKGLSKGDRVTEDKVIGYAGDTGGGNIPVGRVHIHTAFYRYAKTTSDGAPYGGAGLKVVRHRYVGTAAKSKDVRISSHVYKYDKIKPERSLCREAIRCGEKYLVSN